MHGVATPVSHDSLIATLRMAGYGTIPAGPLTVARARNPTFFLAAVALALAACVVLGTRAGGVILLSHYRSSTKLLIYIYICIHIYLYIHI